MTVQELKQLLRRMPATATVVIACDTAQSNVQRLDFVQFGYWEKNEAFGEFHPQADADDPTYDWKPAEETVFAVCLTPEE